MYGLGFLFYKFCFENIISIFLAYFAMEYFMLCLNDSFFFLKPIVVSQKEKKKGGRGGGGGGGGWGGGAMLGLWDLRTGFL